MKKEKRGIFDTGKSIFYGNKDWIEGVNKFVEKIVNSITN